MEHIKDCIAALREAAPEIDIAENELMRRHTTFAIGGPADLFVQPKTRRELTAALAVLRERNGTDPEVRDYVFRGGTADVLMRYLTGMIDFLLPRYIAEGKANLIISIGCTGGKHRSVAITEALSEHLRRKEYGVVTMHRDYQR